jgi:hypothetical protein
MSLARGECGRYELYINHMCKPIKYILHLQRLVNSRLPKLCYQMMFNFIIEIDLYSTPKLTLIFLCWLRILLSWHFMIKEVKPANFSANSQTDTDFLCWLRFLLSVHPSIL